MKKHIFARVLTILVLMVGWSATRVYSGAPPLTEEFLSSALPGAPFAFASTAEGRIEIEIDETDLQSESVPRNWFIATYYSGGNRMRGNYYQCDTDALLTQVRMYLMRPVSTKVIFSVYESDTENGTYSLLASSTIQASSGTNVVYSGSLDARLRAGKYYLVATSWDQSVGYRSGGSHPASVAFGESLRGYLSNAGYQPPATASGSTNSLLYPQQLTFSVNHVVRMDDSVDASLVSTNHMDLYLSLDGYSDLSLSFRHRSLNDESDTADGIFLSDDSASTFTRVYALNSGNTGWENLTLDIGALASANGLSLNNHFVIRFQQSDNYSASQDGREFDDIKVYASEPDLVAKDLDSNGISSPVFLWKGLDVNKAIPVDFEVQSRGSGSDFHAAVTQFGYELTDESNTTVFYQGDNYSWDIDAMEIRTDTMSRTLVIPAATRLTNLVYTLHAYADAQGQISELFESNNEETMSLTVNQYSGWLWFGNIRTEITISSWSPRVAGSATEHMISGTGVLDGHNFAFTNLKVIKNQSTLDYSVDPSETKTVPVTLTERRNVSRVSYWLDGAIHLSKNGAFGDVKVLLPAGLGISTNDNESVMDATFTFFDRKLTQDLYPDTTVQESGTFYVVEETKPIVYEVSTVRWTPTSGGFTFARSAVYSTQQELYEFLRSRAPQYVDGSMAEKKSNNSYYCKVLSLLSDLTVETGAHSEALLSTRIRIAPSELVAHFPYGVAQAWDDVAYLRITQDLIDSSDSYFKEPAPVSVSYQRDCCCNLPCAGHTAMGTVGCEPAEISVMGPNGGIRTDVVITNGGAIAWGYRADTRFVQESKNPFARGSVYIPGHFVRGDLSGFSPLDQRGPAEILLAGMTTNSSATLELPSQPDYADGLGDYAGLNLRVGTNSILMTSVLGGRSTDAWELTGRSKYYLRYSGVSGIHEAVPETLPKELKIYDYSFGLSNYGLSYLSGNPEESRINGLVVLKKPCSFEMDFEELMLDCLGELGEAELANSDEKTLAYWDARIQPLTLFFAPTASSTCANAMRVLCMGLTTRCANIDETLSGVLGFLSSGYLATPATEISGGISSRLATPNKIELAGPNGEPYYFTPTAMPYYNSYEQSGDTMSNLGWINFAGNIDVSFFDDLQVHFHTSASTNSAIANIYMMGGWEDDHNNSFFNSDPDGFDRENVGYPNDKITYSEYRNPASDTYRVHARRTWLGVIDFDYPLEWSTASKSFKSPSQLDEDLLLVKIQHQVDYLSGSDTEISFGMQYDGVPQINLCNLAFNAIDEGTGMASAFTDAVGDEIHAAIESGLSAMDDTLSDIPEQLFDPIFDKVLDPLVDDFYTDLYAAYVASPTATDFGSVVTQYIYDASASAYGSVGSVLSNLADSASASVNLLGQIDDNLDRAVELIDAFASTVTATNGVSLPGGLPPIPGLLSVDAGEYQVLADLGVGILSELASTLYDSIKDSVQDEINEVLESAAPSLEAITTTLLDLREIIVEVQGRLDAGKSVAQELSAVLNSPLVLDTLNTVSAEIMQQLEAISVYQGSFDEYTPEEIKTMLRQAITDAFYGSVPCADVQQVIRSQLYELEAMIQQGVDSALQQLNQAIKNIASEFLSGIDEEINGMLGDLSDVIGAGQIDGYAHIRYDTLNELRLDGKFQWKVPDEMEFNAFLLIKDMNSSLPGGCGVSADSLPEVTLGTTDFGLGMLGSDIRADISTKFAFAENGGDLKLIGMGGAFEMTEGQIGFESFSIDEFYAAVAFGALENYLSASIHCTFTEYEVEGGIFLGKTCTLEPFSWDPDVQEVLGEPPFTGIYVYGEGWMPIVDYGCLFRVRAGVGAGIFYFVDGPVGGKIFLGADGEALCVVNVAGEVTLVGLKDGDDMRMVGKGKISGRAGSCPFCIKFSKSVKITYDNGNWDADY